MPAPLVGVALRTGARLIQKQLRTIKQTKGPKLKNRTIASKAVKTVKKQDLKGANKRRKQTKKEK